MQIPFPTTGHGSQLWEAKATGHPIPPPPLGERQSRHQTPRSTAILLPRKPVLIPFLARLFQDSTNHYFLDVLICKAQILPANV